ncbi:MAG: pyrroline-5-carboxylate reductase [Cellvibrionaceae bacterium]|nr:pyrroline-5-carboxylate reductase [Cellvibrionaceae bacterium]
MNNITFIGAGNMASSIIGGLIAQGYAADAITASDPQVTALAALETQFGIQGLADNIAACKHADIIVLAVKPQVLKEVALTIAPAIGPQALIISIAAGITSGALAQWLGADRALVRCMPNTPALIQLGATGLYANSRVSRAQKQQAEQLLGAVGTVVWLADEAQLDTVTAVSGSGPAYFFLFMEAMIAAGVQQGLAPEQARQLTLQTAIGAAKLAQHSDVDIAQLRRRVTSPGGTTAQALSVFEQAGLSQIVEEAMGACAERAVSMAKEFI